MNNETALEPNVLPVIDFAAVRAGDPQGTRAAAGRIRAACIETGFFYIRNHGIPQDVIARAVAVSQRFFRLPVEEKKRVAVNRTHRGFNALGDALMYGASKPDYKEFFSVGLELPEDDPDVVAGQALRGPNNWPEFMPELRPALYDFYEALGRCGEDLLRAVAVSLDVDEDFFRGKYTKPLQRTQVVYYPPHPQSVDEDLFGVAPHTDFGCITLLWQDDNGGLEVRHRNGQWIQAAPMDGTFVVNVGDLLGRWTNDRFASTLHRVINRSGRERFSIATFYDPSYTAVVDPRDLGTSDGECRYQPVAAGEHIVGRINASFGYRNQ